VFAGYGVVAPEYQWNDYAGLDAKGKRWWYWLMIRVMPRVTEGLSLARP